MASDEPASEVLDRAYPEWRIASAGYEAVITAVGATLREFTHRGRHLVVPFDQHEIRPRYRGAILAPWPNRVGNGKYVHQGRHFQLPINEVERGHALHGLVHWARWEPVATTPTSVTLRHTLVPQDGYPFPLQLQAEYRLGPGGLTGRLATTNIGAGAAPYGCCPHPYLVAGSGALDSWRLTMPAARRLEIDDRLLPRGLVPVTEVDSDFRSPAAIGTRKIDHAFTELGRGVDGRVEVALWDAKDDTGVEMSWGPWADWVQIYTADYPERRHHRVGLAVEPMSCPPDAFNLGRNAPILPSGATHVAEWTISALGGRISGSG